VTTLIRNTIAAAAIAALFAPAGFAQIKGDQQDPRAQCEKLNGTARLNCLEKLRLEGKLPPTEAPTAPGRGSPSTPSPTWPSGPPR